MLSKTKLNSSLTKPALHSIMFKGKVHWILLHIILRMCVFVGFIPYFKAYLNAFLPAYIQAYTYIVGYNKLSI